MATGDIQVYIAAADDDGTKLDAVLTGNSIVVADSISMTKIGTKIWVLVVKA